MFLTYSLDQICYQTCMKCLLIRFFFFTLPFCYFASLCSLLLCQNSFSFTDIVASRYSVCCKVLVLSLTTGMTRKFLLNRANALGVLQAFRATCFCDRIPQSFWWHWKTACLSHPSTAWVLCMLHDYLLWQGHLVLSGNSPCQTESSDWTNCSGGEQPTDTSGRRGTLHSVI